MGGQGLRDSATEEPRTRPCRGAEGVRGEVGDGMRTLGAEGLSSSGARRLPKHLLHLGLWVLVLCSCFGRSWGLQELIGGDVHWEISPDFLNGDRKVTVSMKTTMVADRTTCQYFAGSEPTCNPDNSPASSCHSEFSTDADKAACLTAETHGVMCVAQFVIQRPSTTEEYAHLYSQAEAQCVHSLNKREEVTDSDGATYPAGSNLAPDDEIGEVNSFLVDYILDQDDTPGTAEATAMDRKRNSVTLVTGTLTKTITVNPKAAAVVAWLAPRKGFENHCRERGLLLTSCEEMQNTVSPSGVISATSDSGKACTVNIEALQRGTGSEVNANCPAGSQAVFKTSAFDAIDSFWEGFEDKWFSQGGCYNGDIGCFGAASPALETFIPVCSTSGIYGGCSTTDFVLENYYSAVTAIPHVIETTVTRLDSDRTRYTGHGGAGSAVASPHDGFAPQIFDVDGQSHSLYAPELLQDLKADNVKNGPVNGNFRMDCSRVPRIETAGVSDWQAAQAICGPLGCLEGYDFDSDADKARGSYLKLDFDFQDALEYTFVDQKTTDNNDDGNLPLVTEYYPWSATRPVFSQHYINTLDRPRSLTSQPATQECNSNSVVREVQNNYREKAGLVQNVFSAYTCYSGDANMPPVFVESADAGPTETNVLTSFECPFWERCEIDVFVKDFDNHDETGVQTDQGIFVEGAVGFMIGDRDLVIPPELTQSCLTASGGTLHCKYILQKEMADSRSYLHSAIGRMFSMCLVAYDLPGTAGNRCPSTPYCFKMQIVGTRPMFSTVTPMAESRTADGELVELQHDYPACEGFPMELRIKVEDTIPDTGVTAFTQDPSKRFRIFVYDKTVESDPVADGVLYDPDFFDKEADPMIFDRLGDINVQCGDNFAPYNASRLGLSDSLQHLTVIGDAEPREASNSDIVDPRYAVINDYNPDFVYYPNTANVTVQFFPRVQDRNGIAMRLDSSCTRSDYVAPNQRCREKVMNQDQLICAVGYDNSRSTHKRWVGNRKPSDMSQGDYSSETRCWRILMEAPPVFITDPDGDETPFGDWETVGASETTDHPSAYKTVTWRVHQENSLNFLAQDPNPEDRVEIFILASPGIPDGMAVGESRCIVRDPGSCLETDGENCIRRGMCGMVGDVFTAGLQSDCSRARRSLTWTPGSETAGKEFRICASARDDSTACYFQDNAPPLATPRGWFGEQQCVIIEVAGLTVQFAGALAEGTAPPSDVDDPSYVTHVKGYVGCQMSLTVSASDVAVPAGTSTYDVAAQLVPNAILGATGTSSGNNVTALWTPSRGMEGQSFDLCFAADDLPPLDILPAPITRVCLGGTAHLQGCQDVSECTGGGKCVPACVRIDVQRCEYCVQEAETLIYMVQKFQLDTNWLKLWALNSYQGTPAKEFLPGSVFIEEANDADLAFFKDPDLLMDSEGMHRFIIGPTYMAGSDDDITSVAAKFRTTVKTLLSVNPDIDENAFPMNGQGAGQHVCVLPCTIAPV